MEVHIISLTILVFLAQVQNFCNGTPPSKLTNFHPLPEQTKLFVSWEDNVLQTQENDDNRVRSLINNTSIPVAWGRRIINTPSYVVDVQLGATRQKFLLALDISSDIAWIPCNGCRSCTSNMFNITNSSTFSSVKCESLECSQAPHSACSSLKQCTFHVGFAGSSILAYLGKDTLTIGQHSLPHFVFGCVSKVKGVDALPRGLLGLGRGPLSLISQSGLNNSTFSYCLPTILSGNFTGSLRFGPAGLNGIINTTQLLWNQKRPSLYYVNLEGIKFGGKVLSIPKSAFEFNNQTGSGTIIDTGTIYSRLVPEAYAVLREEFRRRVGGENNVTKLGGFDTCYQAPINSPPIRLIFSEFEWKLPQKNFLVRSTYRNITCLAMAASPTNVDSNLNVIASMQQQNHRVLIDIEGSKIGFSREQCS